MISKLFSRGLGNFDCDNFPCPSNKRKTFKRAYGKNRN